MIKIPIESLDRSIIFSIVEEFVLREGTDYGAFEVNFQSKIDEIYRKLESDEYLISYDESTESCTISPRGPLQGGVDSLSSQYCLP